MLQRKYIINNGSCHPLNSNNHQNIGVHFIEISAAQENQRLDNFLLRYFKTVPKTRIYRIIRKGEVRVNKKRCKPEYKLQPGDSLRIPPVTVETSSEAAPYLPEKLLDLIAHSILFENEHFLVINKPAGLAVHSGSGIAFGVIDLIRKMRPDDDIELAHRLDRDTSGCLMLTKNRQVLLDMQKRWQDNSIRKIYLALVKGRWPDQLRKVEHRLIKTQLANGERRVFVGENGKTATSLVKVLSTSDSYTLIEVELLTGRTHQIRVHCQAEGHEIAGDNKYGDPAFDKTMRQKGKKRLMLHASSLHLPQSNYTAETRILAPLPEEFELV
ncbi:MAG: 23S rRNA pseudouridine955/2504/2580 synthase [Gammaproteobacteria bacterium]|jgi:23S rRNA pseudouridine955/2504/2580 synthase